MNFDALIDQGYSLFSTKADGELSINVWRERIASNQGANPFYMRRSPGIRPLITGLKVDAVREMYQANSESDGGMFAVVGDTVYFGAAPSAMTALTGTVTTTGFVQMAASATSLLIISGTHLYRVNGGTLTELVLPFTPIGIAFLKNYFVALSNTFQQFYWSTDDGATFPADQVQTAEADANNVLGIQALNQQLWCIGSRITQVYFVGTNPNAPLVPNDAAVIRSGTIAAASIRLLGKSLYWIEENAEGRNDVVRTNGYQVDRISNAYIANKLDKIAQQYGTDDAIGWTVSITGTDFYRVSFPLADCTIEFNATLGEWEETPWRDFRTSTDHRHRGQCAVNAFGKTLVGDRENGIIYELSVTEYTDAGYPIRSLRRSPRIVEEQRYIDYGRLDLDCETGVGLDNPLWLQAYSLQPAAFVIALAAAVMATTVTATQALILQDIYDGKPYIPLNPYPTADVMNALGFTPWGSDATLSDGTVIGAPPQVTMRYSNNSGKVFAMDLPVSVGRAGEDDLEIYWNRLGQSKNRVFEFEDSNPCKLAWLNAYLEAQAL